MRLLADASEGSPTVAEQILDSVSKQCAIAKFCGN